MGPGRFVQFSEGVGPGVSECGQPRQGIPEGATLDSTSPAAEPEELVRDVLQSGETIISYLLVRSKARFSIDCGNSIIPSTMARATNAAGEILPQEFFDRVLPNWIVMQRHLSQLALARASVSRQNELSRAKQLENNRLERELKTMSIAAAPIDGSPSAPEAAPIAATT